MSDILGSHLASFFFRVSEVLREANIVILVFKVFCVHIASVTYAKYAYVALKTTVIYLHAEQLKGEEK